MLFSTLFKCPVTVGQPANRLGVLCSFLRPRMALYVQILQYASTFTRTQGIKYSIHQVSDVVLTLFKCPVIGGQPADRLGVLCSFLRPRMALQVQILK